MKKSKQSHTAAAVVEAIEQRVLLSVSVVKDIIPGPAGSFSRGGADTSGTLRTSGGMFFAAADPSSTPTSPRYGLWYSDGTAGETFESKSTGESIPQEITYGSGDVYFVEDDADHAMTPTPDYRLWETNGEFPATMVADLGTDDRAQITPVANQYTYFVKGGAVWRNIRSGMAQQVVPAGSVHPVLSTYNGQLLVDSDQLYIFDGTNLTPLGPRTVQGNASPAAGTTAQKRPSTAVLRGWLYFLSVPADGQNQPRLYRSDGTPQGTTLVKLLDPAPAGASYVGPVVAGGKLIFSVGKTLYVSDGTSAGTTILDANLPLAQTAAGNDIATTLNGDAFFIARDLQTNALQLWMTDGSQPGTVPVSDNLGSNSYGPTMLEYDGRIYFTAPARGLSTGQILWQTDGTPQGTRPVAANYGSDLTKADTYLVGTGGRQLFFSPSNPITGNELFKISPAGVTINGTDGADVITVSAAADRLLTADVNGTVTTYTPTQYAEGITINTVNSNSSVGAAGQDVLNILSLPAVNTRVNNYEYLTINVGTDTRGLQDIAAPRLILPDVFGGLTPFININDKGDSVPRHASFSTAVLAAGPDGAYNVLHGLSPGDIYLGHASATVITGQAADTLDIPELGIPFTNTLPVTIDVSHVGTKVNVGPAIYQGLLLRGQPGTTSLTVDESFAHGAASVTDFGIGPKNLFFGGVDFQGSAMASVDFNFPDGGNVIDITGAPSAAGVPMNLNTGRGDDTINVRGLGAASGININGQGGSDTVTVSNSGTIRPVHGIVNISNATGHSRVFIDDSKDEAPRTWYLDTLTIAGQTYGSLTSNLPIAINYNAAQVSSPVVFNADDAGNQITVNHLPAGVFNLNTGNGADTVNVKSTDPGSILNINGQNGADTVTVSNKGSVLAVRGVVNVANPLGKTTLTIDGSAGSGSGQTTLGKFTAAGQAYGSLQGLAPAPINFDGSNVADVNIVGGDGTDLLITGTPGGGAIDLSGCAVVNVQDLAPGQKLNVDSTSAAAPRAVSLQFAAIGDGSGINIRASELIIAGQFATDQFTLSGGAVARNGTSVRFAKTGVVVLETGMLNVIENLSDFSGTTFQAYGSQVNLLVSQSELPDLLNGALVKLFPGGQIVTHGNLPEFNGKLDLGTGQWIINNATANAASQIRGLLRRALSGGSGITSSAADSSHGVGFVTSLSGGLTTAKIAYALLGDTDFNGKVDFTDLLALAQNYGKIDAFWFQGDFNYDGKVDFADLLTLSQNFHGTASLVPGVRRSR